MENKIIELYLSGFGSTTIVKKLSIPKRKVLKILNDNNLINKLVPKEYENFKFENDVWYDYYQCDCCLKEIKSYASTKFYLLRNLKNKKTCKICSLKKQSGENNPFFNKTHSNETKKQISKKKKGIKTSDHMSKLEYRKMFSDMKKNLWDSGKMEGVRKKMSDIMKKRISNGEIKGYNRSKVEDEIIKTLTDLSIECSPNHIVESKIFDIFIPKFNLLIEYNGDYWHCNPIKYSYDYINKKKNKTAGEIWEYDKNKLYLAKNKGYNCVVVWETDYKKNKNIILEIIKNYEKN